MIGCWRPSGARATGYECRNMNRFLHSVRLRLTLWYGGVLALVLVVFALSVYVFVVRSIQANVDTALQSYGQQVNVTAAKHVRGKNLDVSRVPVPRHEPYAALFMMNTVGQKKRVARSKNT